ncbi:MAG TPA: translation initiation factor IF-3 [Balneolales bacterium]|nr:translation initiation factor IF-3 [Balneolales bacterium]
MARRPYIPNRIRNNTDDTRVNEDIKASKVRLIYPDGENHEIVPIERALEVAEQYDLDLVEIAPEAKPPVVKVMDYKKHLYEKRKKEREARKKQHTVQVKELRFRPHTDDHDYNFKIRHARKFLEEGNKVKATVQFRGRDIIYSDQGRELLVRLAGDLDDIGKVESPPTLEGKRMSLIIAPAKQ